MHHLTHVPTVNVSQLPEWYLLGFDSTPYIGHNIDDPKHISDLAFSCETTDRWQLEVMAHI